MSWSRADGMCYAQDNSTAAGMMSYERGVCQGTTIGMFQTGCTSSSCTQCSNQYKAIVGQCSNFGASSMQMTGCGSASPAVAAGTVAGVGMDATCTTVLSVTSVNPSWCYNASASASLAMVCVNGAATYNYWTSSNTCSGAATMQFPAPAMCTPNSPSTGSAYFTCKGFSASQKN